MYPPKATDGEVRGLIRELTKEGRLPSGTLVREALYQRYRTRGGVARIYRLLAAERPAVLSSEWSVVSARLLEVEKQTLLDQLKQMRRREEAHQAHWHREIENLRSRILALKSLAEQGATGPSGELLKQEIDKAEIRAGQLSVLLRAFGPAVTPVKLTD